MPGLPSRSGHVELIVSRAGHPDRRLLLKPGVLRLGRAEDNDLVLPDIGVSRRHARIIVDDTGVTVEDLGSGNGTLFQGRPVRKKRIEDNDILRIDPFDLRFRVRSAGARPVNSADTLGGPRIILITDSDVPASVYPIPATGLTLGRATNQNVVLNDPGASRQHAVLFPRQGGCWLQDNRSANGTHVNDERVYQHLVQHNDVIRIGNTMFRLDLGAPNIGADPFGELWDESGVHPRAIRDDDDPEPVPPTFNPPPSHPLPPTIDSEPTAKLPDARAGQGQGRLLLAVGVLLIFLVVVLIVAVVVVPRLISLPELVAVVTGEPAVEAPEPDTTLPVVVGGTDAGERMVMGRALLSAGRPLEAATPLYQALKSAPDVEELERLGYVACEAAAMQILLADLRLEGRAPLNSRALRALGKRASSDSDDTLLALRAELSDALRIQPEDTTLLRALGTVDSRLAGLATRRVAAAAAEADAGASWSLLEEALALSPTTGAASSAAWERISTGRAVAQPLLQQALSLEVIGQPDEARRLYATAAAKLPGQLDPLERLARARMDALAR